MNYKNLGRTGAKVSPLCLGSMNFGSGADEQQSIAMMHRALDAGINFWDTADVYSGRGKSETIVGKAFGRQARRSVSGHQSSRQNGRWAQRFGQLAFAHHQRLRRQFAPFER